MIPVFPFFLIPQIGWVQEKGYVGLQGFSFLLLERELSPYVFWCVYLTSLLGCLYLTSNHIQLLYFFIISVCIKHSFISTHCDKHQRIPHSAILTLYELASFLKFSVVVMETCRIPPPAKILALMPLLKC